MRRKYFLKQRNYEIPFDMKIAPRRRTIGARKYGRHRIGDMERESEKGGQKVVGLDRDEFGLFSIN